MAKYRRDVKNSFEQHSRAVSCGDVPLVKIPILGRVVRLFGDWMAHLQLLRLPRQDPADVALPRRHLLHALRLCLLVGKGAAAAMDAALPKEPPPACRFCGKVQPENCTGTKWRKVNAPLDANGKNATVPAPLRICFYCPSHFRSWLPTAHQSLSTSEIFSHLAQKARPVHGAKTQAATGCTASESVAAAPKQIRHIQTKVCPRQTNRQEQSKSPPDHRHASTRVSCLVKTWLLCPKKSNEKNMPRAPKTEADLRAWEAKKGFRGVISRATPRTSDHTRLR